MYLKYVQIVNFKNQKTHVFNLQKEPILLLEKMILVKLNCGRSFKVS